LSGYGKSPTVSLRQPTPPEHQELNQHYMIVLTRQKLKWFFFWNEKEKLKRCTVMFRWMACIMVPRSLS
jgi:hypothetical protein